MNNCQALEMKMKFPALCFKSQDIFGGLNAPARTELSGYSTTQRPFLLKNGQDFLLAQIKDAFED